MSKTSGMSKINANDSVTVRWEISRYDVKKIFFKYDGSYKV